jgi:hypothetical protein
MNARTYNLDADAARETESSGSDYIASAGKYKGKFTRAEAIKSPKGTDGVEFGFLSDDGKEAGFLTFWTYNAKGETLYGHKMLMALMTCMKARSLQPSQAQLEKYNFNSKTNEKTEMTVYQDLMNKPIGLILREEEYINNSGELKTKLAIFQSFTHDTEQVASEVLDAQGMSSQLESIVKYVAENPVKKVKNPPQQNTANVTQVDNGSDLMNDDIPF